MKDCYVLYLNGNTDHRAAAYNYQSPALQSVGRKINSYGKWFGLEIHGNIKIILQASVCATTIQ